MHAHQFLKFWVLPADEERISFLPERDKNMLKSANIASFCTVALLALLWACTDDSDRNQPSREETKTPSPTPGPAASPPPGGTFPPAASKSPAPAANPQIAAATGTTAAKVIPCRAPLPADSKCIETLTKEMVDKCAVLTKTAEKPEGSIACKTTTWAKLVYDAVMLKLDNIPGTTPFAVSSAPSAPAAAPAAAQ